MNLKERLQFTGWLQYIIPLVLSLILFISSLLLLLFSTVLSQIFGSIAAFLVIVSLYNVLTVKFNFRPNEKRPKRMDKIDAFDLMKNRSSCRSFQNRKLISTDYNELLDVVKQINTPKDKMIGKNPVRFEYIDKRITVWPVVGAQEFLVAIVPKTYSRESIIDVGRNLQKIVLHASKMGLATCWIGPGADQSSIIQRLGDKFNPLEDHIICVCAIGYKSKFKPLFLRFAQLIQHNRLPISSLFFTDSKLQTPLEETANPYNRFGRNYEVCQWAPSAFNGQTTRCVAVSETNKEQVNESFLKRFDFYTSTKSRYYAPVALGIWCANWELGCESLSIKGHFEILSEKERDLPDNSIKSELPVYGVSWILEESN